MSPRTEVLPGTTKRVAIYARYSSDLQNARSIDDQIRICRERLEREGWTVHECYSDYALSGSTLMRPGTQTMRTLPISVWTRAIAAQTEPMPHDT